MYDLFNNLNPDVYAIGDIKNNAIDELKYYDSNGAFIFTIDENGSSVFYDVE